MNGWIVPIPIVFFVLCVWGATLTLIPRFSRWYFLAQRFRAIEIPVGTTFRMQNGRFNWCDYSNCLKYIVAPSGLYVSIFPPFSLTHRALLVPWNEMRYLRDYKFWFYRAVRVEIGTPTITEATIPQPVLEAAIAAGYWYPTTAGQPTAEPVSGALGSDAVGNV